MKFLGPPLGPGEVGQTKAVAATPIARRRGRILPLLGAIVFLTQTAVLLRAQNAAIPDPIKSGRELADRMRKAGPASAARFTGTLIVRRANHTNQMPVASVIQTSPATLNETNSANQTGLWMVRYSAGEGSKRETLVIVHTSGLTNRYFNVRGTNLSTNTSAANADDALGSPLGLAELFQPFAGSDFWRIDLGLDFFAWPEQRLLNANQMRRGRACRVLESRLPNPPSGGYSRVVSWIDIETDGILRAEAYDTKGKLSKEFLVGKFRKVNGEYQLEEMTIRKGDGAEESEIRFDLGPEPDR